MNNSNDNSALLREIAIIDYVAGNQGEAARHNFEKMIAQDPTLREAVQAEQRFRTDMQKAGELAPVSMSNFDVLLTTIEQANKEDAAPVSNVSSIANDTSSSVLNDVEKPSNVVTPSVSFWNNRYSVAASVAVFAMIFSSFYLNLSEPSFETLSDQSASEEINFVALAEQGRLAKMVLSEQVSQTEIDSMLQSYQLTTFESGSSSIALYVVAATVISDSDLERMRADSRIQKVEIFSAKTEG